MLLTTETEIERRSFWDLSKEEKEAKLAVAAKRAQDNLHTHGLPYVIGNTEGMYEVYPDGEEVFIPYSK